MEIFTLWLGTTIASIGMDWIHKLTMLKDIADFGYKLNEKEARRLEEESKNQKKQEQSLLLLIPILNILDVVQRTTQYNCNKVFLLNQLRVGNLIKKMSPLEEEEYLKKPTAFNALLLPFKVKKRLDSATSIQINDHGQVSEFICELGENQDDINILEVKGVAASFSIMEQQEKIKSALHIIQENSEAYSSMESLTSALNQEKDLNLYYHQEDLVETLPIKKKQSIQETTPEIEHFASFLLEEQLRQQEKKEEEKGHAKVKK